MDWDLIKTEGKKAMGHLLKQLNIFKSTCDVKRATEMYAKYSSVPEELKGLRPIVLKNKGQRKMEL